MENIGFYILLKIAVSLLPVFVFLLLLIILDSFKIVTWDILLQGIIAGCIAALISFLVTSKLVANFTINITIYSRYIAPFLEELLKAVFIFYLIRARKIGFMVDAAIYGFAVGAGFAFAENIYYLQTIQNPNLLLWVIRGFGTAVMHGGTTAIFAIISKNLFDRKAETQMRMFMPGLLAAYLIHSLFNHFLISPFLYTIGQLLILPAVIIIIFKQSENSLRNWLELGLDSDVTMLEDIKSGRVSESKIGWYLNLLKESFPPEILVDIICYLRIHLELSARAKGYLLMQEAGYNVKPDPVIKEKLTELEYLEKSIGKTGKLTLSMILHNSTQDLWQIYLLEKK